MGGNIFENTRGGSGHNQLPTMKFYLLPDFLTQWAVNVSEADFFFLILCSQNILFDI